MISCVCVCVCVSFGVKLPHTRTHIHTHFTVPVRTFGVHKLHEAKPDEAKQTSYKIGTIAPPMCASERDSGRRPVLFKNSKLFGI